MLDTSLFAITLSQGIIICIVPALWSDDKLCLLCVYSADLPHTCCLNLVLHSCGEQEPQCPYCSTPLPLPSHSDLRLRLCRSLPMIVLQLSCSQSQ